MLWARTVLPDLINPNLKRRKKEATITGIEILKEKKTIFKKRIIKNESSNDEDRNWIW